MESEFLKIRRIEWIDDLKGLGIFLIVLGHVVATVKIMAGKGAIVDVLGWLFDYIYSFHVPFFFLLDEPFVVGKELTASLKMKRNVIAKKYASQIEALYN